MMRRVLWGIGGSLLVGAAYFTLWPVPIDPVAWEPPVDRGHTGPHEANQGLAEVERVPVPELSGPEDLVVDPDGTLYTTSHEGWIARAAPGAAFSSWVNTGGRPLGLGWDAHGDRLVVADAYDGLLAIDRAGVITVLTTEADGVPIEFADDVVADDEGRLYFSDASTKFGARAWGGTYPASLLDIFEHGGHGRLLRYDPSTEQTTTLLEGLDFANGVALGPRQQSVLLAETGTYRVIRHFVAGPRAGETEVVIDNLPGYPDNLAQGQDGRYWVGLVSTRRAIVDHLAPYPSLRRAVQRLPKAVRPEATRYGHVIAFTIEGEVVMDLQDPSGAYARTTGALEHGDWLWITSLHEPDLGRLPLRLP